MLDKRLVWIQYYMDVYSGNYIYWIPGQYVNFMMTICSILQGLMYIAILYNTVYPLYSLGLKYIGILYNTVYPLWIYFISDKLRLPQQHDFFILRSRHALFKLATCQESFIPTRATQTTRRRKTKLNPSINIRFQ